MAAYAKLAQSTGFKNLVRPGDEESGNGHAAYIRFESGDRRLSLQIVHGQHRSLA